MINNPDQDPVPAEGVEPSSEMPVEQPAPTTESTVVEQPVAQAEEPQRAPISEVVIELIEPPAPEPATSVLFPSVLVVASESYVQGDHIPFDDQPGTHPLSIAPTPGDGVSLGTLDGVEIEADEEPTPHVIPPPQLREARARGDTIVFEPIESDGEEEEDREPAPAKPLRKAKPKSDFVPASDEDAAKVEKVPEVNLAMEAFLSTIPANPQVAETVRVIQEVRSRSEPHTFEWLGASEGRKLNLGFWETEYVPVVLEDSDRVLNYSKDELRRGTVFRIANLFVPDRRWVHRTGGSSLLGYDVTEVAESTYNSRHLLPIIGYYPEVATDAKIAEEARAAAMDQLWRLAHECSTEFLDLPTDLSEVVRSSSKKEPAKPTAKAPTKDAIRKRRTKASMSTEPPSILATEVSDPPASETTVAEEAVPATTAESNAPKPKFKGSLDLKKDRLEARSTRTSLSDLIVACYAALTVKSVKTIDFSKPLREELQDLITMLRPEIEKIRAENRAVIDGKTEPAGTPTSKATGKKNSPSNDDDIMDGTAHAPSSKKRGSPSPYIPVKGITVLDMEGDGGFGSMLLGVSYRGIGPLENRGVWQIRSSDAKSALDDLRIMQEIAPKAVTRVCVILSIVIDFLNTFQEFKKHFLFFSSSMEENRVMRPHAVLLHKSQFPRYEERLKAIVFPNHATDLHNREELNQWFEKSSSRERIRLALCSGAIASDLELRKMFSVSKVAMPNLDICGDRIHEVLTSEDRRSASVTDLKTRAALCVWKLNPGVMVKPDESLEERIFIRSPVSTEYVLTLSRLIEERLCPEGSSAVLPDRSTRYTDSNHVLSKLNRDERGLNHNIVVIPVDDETWNAAPKVRDDFLQDSPKVVYPSGFSGYANRHSKRESSRDEDDGGEFEDDFGEEDDDGDDADRRRKSSEVALVDDDEHRVKAPLIKAVHGPVTAFLRKSKLGNRVFLVRSGSETAFREAVQLSWIESREGEPSPQNIALAKATIKKVHLALENVKSAAAGIRSAEERLEEMRGKWSVHLREVDILLEAARALGAGRSLEVEGGSDQLMQAFRSLTFVDSVERSATGVLEITTKRVMVTPDDVALAIYGTPTGSSHDNRRILDEFRENLLMVNKERVTKADEKKLKSLMVRALGPWKINLDEAKRTITVQSLEACSPFSAPEAFVLGPDEPYSALEVARRYSGCSLIAQVRKNGAKSPSSINRLRWVDYFLEPRREALQSGGGEYKSVTAVSNKWKQLLTLLNDMVSEDATEEQVEDVLSQIRALGRACFKRAEIRTFPHSGSTAASRPCWGCYSFQSFPTSTKDAVITVTNLWAYISQATDFATGVPSLTSWFPVSPPRQGIVGLEFHILGRRNLSSEDEGFTSEFRTYE